MQSSEFKQLAEDALDDLKATDVVALDVSGFTSITDYMLIASGTSDRHVRSIADSVIEKAREVGQPVLGVEGHEYGEWVLVDLGDVVVHIMQPRDPRFLQAREISGAWTTSQGDRPTPSRPAEGTPCTFRFSLSARECRSGLTTAFKEYTRRMPRQIQFSIEEIQPGHRTARGQVAAAREQEAAQLKKKAVAADLRIVLDEKGKPWTSMELADQLRDWLQHVPHVATDDRRPGWVHGRNS